MERRLVELAMHGDEEAFDLLVEGIGDGLHSVARRILRDTTLAQDATQEALPVGAPAGANSALLYYPG